MRARFALAGVTPVVLLALAAASAGCSTSGESPSLPRLRLPQRSAPADPVYSGTPEIVYRSAFEAIVAEFNTSPRIVKPERGLIVFSEEGSDANTSVLVAPAGETASVVRIESHNAGGLITGRAGNAIRGRLINALDDRLARAEQVEPPPAAPRGTSALAEKQEALDRIQAALGFPVAPGYLIDLEAADLQHLADAIDRRVGVRALTMEERRESAQLAVALGKELHDTGRYEEARDALEHAVALQPDNAVAHCNLGEIYKHLRDFDRCLHHLREAERLDPGYTETYINLGIVFDDYVIDEGQALASYRKYLELGGTDPRVHDWIQELEGGRASAGQKEAS